ncbi:hypothetical protein E6C70_15665 [Glaciibacter flavus]|uniref:Histidine kinase n=1 Tax=Orlajensenia flava TaxID=2565934 RepID=A0A4S4FIP7_9MICO|nr:hypothetical protein [Glaciibacter flavus]THG29055.1 hypothetical protein E6C70_15665 [Glaciibacter flavus]
MTGALGVHRPASVVVIAVLAFVAAALDLLVGGLVLAAGMISAAPSAFEVTLGIGAIIVGVAIIVVGVGLLRGNPVARVVTIVIESLSVVASILLIVLAPSSVGNVLPGLLIALLVVLLLFRPDVVRYFRGLAEDPPAGP